MHDPEIWTNAARELLFERLVRLFGPAKDWTSLSSPGRGFNDTFDEFCKAFARAIGAASGDAVKIQIRHAIYVNETGYWINGHAQAAILNKAAALKAGFINSSHIPKHLIVNKKAVIHETRQQPI